MRDCLGWAVKHTCVCIVVLLLFPNICHYLFFGWESAVNFFRLPFCFLFLIIVICYFFPICVFVFGTNAIFLFVLEAVSIPHMKNALYACKHILTFGRRPAKKSCKQTKPDQNKKIDSVDNKNNNNIEKHRSNCYKTWNTIFFLLLGINFFLSRYPFVDVYTLCVRFPSLLPRSQCSFHKHP